VSRSADTPLASGTISCLAANRELTDFNVPSSFSFALLGATIIWRKNGAPLIPVWKAGQVGSINYLADGSAAWSH
jgi:hypothetical protein